MTLTLDQIYDKYRVDGGDFGHADKGSTHSYIPIYEELLAPYRNGCNFMEIGLAMGLSLAMWREYMPNSKIVGVDQSIVFDAKPHEASGTILVAADATKPEFLDKLPKGMMYDIIIDDASHMCQDQCATFQLLKPLMNPGGLYVIEDLLNVEACRPCLDALHDKAQLYDLREVKHRFDDALWVARF